MISLDELYKGGGRYGGLFHNRSNAVWAAMVQCVTSLSQSPSSPHPLDIILLPQ